MWEAENTLWYELYKYLSHLFATRVLVLKKYTPDFLFTCGTQHNWRGPQPAT